MMFANQIHVRGTILTGEVLLSGLFNSPFLGGVRKGLATACSCASVRHFIFSKSSLSLGYPDPQFFDGSGYPRLVFSRRSTQ